jgi:hypothetical protein
VAFIRIGVKLELEAPNAEQSAHCFIHCRDRLDELQQAADNGEQSSGDRHAERRFHIQRSRHEEFNVGDFTAGGERRIANLSNESGGLGPVRTRSDIASGCQHTATGAQPGCSGARSSPGAAESAPAPKPAPASAAPVHPAAEFRTIPSGMSIQVRNNEPIDSQTAEVGQTYTGVVAQDVEDSEGRVAIPHGSNATLVVRSASGQGKIQGQSDLAVDVGSVQVGGRQYRLETTDFIEKGKQGVGTNKRTAIFAGGGTALGTIIGAVAGGGKGAAIGALSGAAAGTATQGLTRGKAVRIPAETVLTFKLEAPVRIREVR